MLCCIVPGRDPGYRELDPLWQAGKEGMDGNQADHCSDRTTMRGTDAGWCSPQELEHDEWPMPDACRKVVVRHHRTPLPPWLLLEERPVPVMWDPFVGEIQWPARSWRTCWRWSRTVRDDYPLHRGTPYALARSKCCGAAGVQGSQPAHAQITSCANPSAVRRLAPLHRERASSAAPHRRTAQNAWHRRGILDLMQDLLTGGEGVACSPSCGRASNGRDRGAPLGPADRQVVAVRRPAWPPHRPPRRD